MGSQPMAYTKINIRSTEIPSVLLAGINKFIVSAFFISPYIYTSLSLNVYISMSTTKNIHIQVCVFANFEEKKSLERCIYLKCDF